MYYSAYSDDYHGAAGDDDDSEGGGGSEVMVEALYKKNNDEDDDYEQHCVQFLNENLFKKTRRNHNFLFQILHQAPTINSNNKNSSIPLYSLLPLPRLLLSVN